MGIAASAAEIFPADLPGSPVRSPIEPSPSPMIAVLMRYVVWTIVLLALAAGLGWIGWQVAVRVLEARKESSGSRPEPAAAVEVVEVEYGLIRDVRRFTGTLRPRSEVEIAPRISGRLKRLHVDIGDVVDLGQVIAELDDEEFVQELEQARADLLVATANIEERQNAMEIAERDYQRVQRLHEQRIASESELDAARSRYQQESAGVKVAEAEIARREAAVRAAEVRLSYTIIHATWERGGTTRIVGERFVDEGATIAANTPLVSLLDIDPLTAIVYVTERDYMPLRVGMEAELVADTQPNEAYHGRIMRMSPAFREGSRQARVEIELSNPEHTLKPGMFVRARLEIARDENAAIIPRQALLMRNGVEGVFTVDRESMTAHFTPVTIGIRDRERVQIIGEDFTRPIVVLGQHLLSEGMTVTIPDDEATEHVSRVTTEITERH